MTTTGAPTRDPWDGIIPPELNDGERYRIMFVTSGQIAAQSLDDANDIDDWNEEVQKAADARTEFAGITFKILGSTSSVAARDNTNTRPGAAHDGVGEKIYWYDGDKLADNYADLYDGDWDSRCRA